MILIPYQKKDQQLIVSMITSLINYHRDLTQSKKEFYQTDQESLSTLEKWLKIGEVLLIQNNGESIGFFYVKYGGNRCAWLEDLMILPDHQGKGLGKLAMKALDDYMTSKSLLALFVDVIPRNERALKMYLDCGFDHLNMIQLRKNYDTDLNKNDPIIILGHEMNRY